MVVGNVFSKKKLEKLVISKSGGNSYVIGYVVVKKELMKRVWDVNVAPGEECFSQQRLLLMDLEKHSNSKKERVKKNRLVETKRWQNK